MRIVTPTLMGTMAVLLACSFGPKTSPGDTDGASSTSGASVGTGTAPTTGVTPTTGASATSGEVSGTDTVPGTSHADSINFLDGPDMGPPGFPDCYFGADDCPEGFKCNPAGGNGNDTPQCVPIVPDAKSQGEPCSVLGDPYDGTDDCEADVVCLFPDDQGNGECHALCEVEGAGAEHLICPSDLQCIRPLCQSCFWGWCAAPCDPRELDACDPGQVCIDVGEDWTCIVDASGDQGQVGDPCDYINACDPGLYCMYPTLIPGCAGESGCCSPYCSTDQPNTCPNAGQGEECISWYSEGQAPPQLATLGVCRLPT